MMPIFTRIAVIVLLPLILAGCGFGNHYKQAKPVAEQFLNQMQAHQFSAAYKLVSPKSQAAFGLQSWQTAWQTIEQKKGAVQSWKLGSLQVSKNYADFHYQLQCANGVATYSIRVVQVSNQWRIGGVKYKY
jgi:hypothetical protein